MESLTSQLRKLSTVDWLIICTIVIAYIPFLRAIIIDKKNGAGQNFWTWLLWFILDITQFASTFIAGGLWVMFLAFIPCCFTATLLLVKHRKKIKPFEKKVAGCVFLCIIIWIMCGPIWAIVFQTASQVIGGLPLLKDTFRKPNEFVKTLFPLSIFAVAHLLSFYRKSGWTIKYTLFPATMLVFTILSMVPIILFIIKERRKKLHP